jgi:hypothetical protein
MRIRRNYSAFKGEIFRTIPALLACPNVGKGSADAQLVVSKRNPATVLVLVKNELAEAIT